VSGASPVILEHHPLKKDWFWLFLLGISLVILGTLAISVPFLATLQFVTFLGILLLMAGGMQIVSAFQSSRWKGFALQLLIAVLYLVSGFLVLENPVNGAAGLTLLMAAFFLFSGIVRVTIAMTERFPGWGWTLLNGGVNILLGLVIWRQFPESAFWMIGLLVGIELLFNGWSWIMLSLVVKKLPEPVVETHHVG